jgi:hypothetical protein
LLGISSVLVLQFGSAFFKADELSESDFDVALILQYKVIKDAYNGINSTDEMRETFFFGTLARSLKTEQVSVFPVSNAKNPILKLCYR